MSDSSNLISFTMLLERCQRIVIPQIQRDYAQGRENEIDVRNAFLGAIQAALELPARDESLPLNLDFIYGSMEGRDGQTFLPLDGQQRLTTLFLLHWYLAWRDDQLAEFRTAVWEGNHARFSYGVRPSSTEFFDALVQFAPPTSPEQTTSVRGLLEDQSWYFLYWRLDPTIQSALTMLDAIHERFRGSTGLYARLVDREQPAITFQLLQLEHFGLSDDLYIKMNARGKPLTAFETFKARFEKLLTTLYPTECRKIDEAECAVPHFFELRMDRQWTDFFWQYKNSASNTFDEAVMNLVWALIRISLEPTNPLFLDHTGLLRTRQISATYTSFHERGWLTRQFADNLICLLEAWSAGRGKLKCQLPTGRYFDEVAFFVKAITDPSGLEYSELALFAGFVAYLRVHEGAVDGVELQEWMRVVFNLVENSNIERSDELGRSFVGLQKLAPHARQILKHLADSQVELQGFSAHQMREETLKAKLILAHPDWRSRIEAAEQHGYFRGQIEFLLEFTGARSHAVQTPVSDWPVTLHAEIQAAFDDKFAKAQRTFGPSGLSQFPEQRHLWQRALLTIGDYLVKGATNYSFATDAASNWDSWKRFLRGNARGYVKTLWEKLDIGKPLASQLQTLIAESTGLEPWRAAVVKFPQVIDYCEEREIRRRDGVQEIYLLKKKQMNGAHAELFSFALYQELSMPAARASLAPMMLDYQSVTMTEFEPSLRLSLYRPPVSIVFDVDSYGGAFRIYTLLAPLAGLAGADEILKDSFRFIATNDLLYRAVSRGDVITVLQELAVALVGLSAPEP
jgi:hypothetical protein